VRIYPKLLSYLLAIVLIVALSGCGYKPSSKYARNVVGERVSTSVIISAQDPENTVIIKDAVDSAIIEIFHTYLTSKRYADTSLTFKISEPSYTPIQYNQDGFVIAYRAKIRLKVKRETKKSIKDYTAVGTYDFSVVPNAVITDQERFEAIRNSAQKAISSFIAQVSAEGSRENRRGR